MELHPAVRKLLASTQKLAQMDPQDAAVDATVSELKDQIALLTSGVDKPTGEKNSHGDHSRKQDIEGLKEQISKLQTAAEIPARNYARIKSILAGLSRAAILASRPQHAAVRPRLAAITVQVAGIFRLVDTAEDLDRPLCEVEKAVHNLYGPSMSDNGAYYFERRNRGHYNESEGAK